MGKILKVASKGANDSILQDTVARAKTKISKKENWKQAQKAARSPEPAKSTLSRRKQRIEDRKQKKVNLQKELGVLYVSHIPHGFYEEQLEKFFSQFGKVTKVRVVRSTISGRSKGYAFIVFRYKEVAHIAAETTNNLLMGKRILKAKVIPPDEVKPKWFYLSTPSSFRSTVATKRREKYINIINKKLTSEEGTKRLNTQKRSVARMVEKLNEKGIDYKCNAV